MIDQSTQKLRYIYNYISSVKTCWPVELIELGKSESEEWRYFLTLPLSRNERAVSHGERSEDISDV